MSIKLFGNCARAICVPVIKTYTYGFKYYCRISCNRYGWIPVGVTLVKKEDLAFFATGIVIGLLTLPITLLIGGGLCGLSGGQIIIQNLIPICISLLCGIGLYHFTQIVLKIFKRYVMVFQFVLMIGLMIGAITHYVDFPLSKEIVPIMDAMQVVCSIALFLLGSLPVSHFLQRLLDKPLQFIGKKLNLDSYSMTGLLITCVSPLPMLSMLEKMNPRGKIMNVAFLVSGASAMGAHLAFVNLVNDNLVTAMLLSKLVGGLIAAIAAYIVGERFIS